MEIPENGPYGKFPFAVVFVSPEGRNCAGGNLPYRCIRQFLDRGGSFIRSGFMETVLPIITGCLCFLKSTGRSWRILSRVAAAEVAI